MTSLRPRTLEDLRQDSQAAWLWDAARGRIVWANPPGVAALGGESVFDLVDRPFDPQDTAVQAIRELAASLVTGQVRPLRLSLPGAPSGETMAVHGSLHLLADGRQGVLLVAEPPPKALPPVAGELAQSALLHLPVPVLICDGSGRVLHGNAAAKEMLDLAAATSLGDLTQPPEQAESLIAGLQRSGVSSAVVSMACRVGQREVRLTLSRLPAGQPSVVCAMLEDVTDRRALERGLQGDSASPARPPQHDAFAMLAKSLQDTIEAQSAPPRKATPARSTPVSSGGLPQGPGASAAPPAHATVHEPVHSEKAPARSTAASKDHAAARQVPGKYPFVPQPVRQSFERSGQAMLIGRGGHALFATSKAALLLGYDSAEELLADDGLWQHLKSVMEPMRHTSLPGKDGEALDLEVTQASVPWVNGPAEQFILKAATAPPPATSKAAAAPESPAATATATPPQPSALAKAAPEPEAPEQQRGTGAPQVIETNELKAMLDVASDGIIALDSTGRILSFSAGAEAIFGMPQGEVRGRAFAELLSADSRKAWRDYLSAMAGPGLASVFNDGREFSAVVKQGGAVPLFVTLGKLQSPPSQASFCAVVRDITQWKRTEQELREAKEAAEQSSRQKSEFLAGISHEIRTPLNAILGFSDVMRTERFGEMRNEKYRAYANDIHASGAHLLALVNDLLDLSKVEAGKLELDFTAVNVTEAVEHALRLLTEDAARANVVVRKSFAAGLPRVVADLRALRQVLLNLLSNAIKYTDAGGQVIVSALMDGNGELVLRVKDSGIGMSVTQLQEALRPYVRVEAAGRTRQGTGLGLPLSKALVEANRAQFTMVSEPGQGTLAEVRFPATRVLAE